MERETDTEEEKNRWTVAPKNHKNCRNRWSIVQDIKEKSERK